MSEIKLLFCALAGCTSHKTVHPEIVPCTLSIYSNNKWLKKRAHTGCTPPKTVHPAVEMCMPGSGCTLNFGHCQVIDSFLNQSSYLNSRKSRTITQDSWETNKDYHSIRDNHAQPYSVSKALFTLSAQLIK